MILAFDIGNTNIKVSLIENEKKDIIKNIGSIKSEVSKHRKVKKKLKELLKGYKYNYRIEGVILVSVVPDLTDVIKIFCKKHFISKIIIVEPALKLNIKLIYDDINTLGSDRIATAVAAYAKYKENLIVIDFGTAITFCVIDKNGLYKGGSIISGIYTSLNALVHNTSRLPKFDVVPGNSLLSSGTISSLQSGAFFSSLYTVTNFILKLSEEAGFDTYKVIATGKDADLFSGYNIFTEIDRDLIFKGLKIIYELNK